MMANLRKDGAEALLQFGAGAALVILSFVQQVL